MDPTPHLLSRQFIVFPNSLADFVETEGHYADHAKQENAGAETAGGEIALGIVSSCLGVDSMGGLSWRSGRVTDMGLSAIEGRRERDVPCIAQAHSRQMEVDLEASCCVLQCLSLYLFSLYPSK